MKVLSISIESAGLSWTRNKRLVVAYHTEARSMTVVSAMFSEDTSPESFAQILRDTAGLIDRKIQK